MSSPDRFNPARRSLTDALSALTGRQRDSAPQRHRGNVMTGDEFDRPSPDSALVALAGSLQVLEALRARGTEPRLRRLLARRRLALLLLRRALGLGTSPLPRQQYQDLDATAVVAGEWRLARLVSAVAEDLPPDHPARSVLAEIRSEIEEAALTLRLILRTRENARNGD